MRKKTFLLVPLFAGLVSMDVLAWEPLPARAPAPADNPTTEAKVALGFMLYMDPRFSATGTVSCNSCHNIMEGGDDSRRVSMGVHGKTGGRNAPTVWNAAFNSVQFWDGRAPLLEDQAKGPVVNPVEMGMSDLDRAMARVKAIPGYAPYFERAFGTDSVSAENAARAVAAFERTLITPGSPYDRYAQGDKGALTEQQQRGLERFASAGCVSCHSGPAFNGPEMPLGTGFYQKFPTFPDHEYVKRYALMADKGRGEVTGKAADDHRYRVPTLRNVTETAPYFHNGAVNDLHEAVRVMARLQLDRELTDADVDDIVAFLGALTGPYPSLTLPRLPETSGRSILVQD